MKIFIAGGSGFLGRELVKRALERGHQVIAQYAQNQLILEKDEKLRTVQMDLTDFEAVDRLLLEEFPEVVMNAAAISNPAGVDENPLLAEKINVELPTRLAQLSFHTSARFYHYSTDMVFDGLSQTPYQITDKPNPTSLYGRQKVQAEEKILEAAAEQTAILRIPILTGNSARGLRSVHEKIFHSLHKGETVKLFTDESRQPTSAENVASLTIELAERDLLTGIFHWAGGESISRYEMGTKILTHFGLPIEMVEALSKKEDPAFADRPSSLLLDCKALTGKVRTPQITFAEQLEGLSIPPELQTWFRETRSDLRK